MSRTRLPVLCALALAAAQLARFASPDHAVDDAWISFRVARNLVEHGALTYNLDAPPVEGMTNLLWTLLSALWVWLPVDPLLPARAVGAALHLGAVGLLAHVAGEEAGERAAWGAGLLSAATGSTAFYAMSGLETPLYTFLFVLALARLQAGARVSAGLALGALAMTRPEGVMTGGLLIGLLALADRRAALAVGLPFAGLVGGTELFRLAYYGAWIPNTFHAKAPQVAGGLDYLGRELLLGLGLVGPLVLVPLRRDRRALGLALVAAAGLAGAVATGGDWMPGLRRGGLELLILDLLAGVALARAAGAGRAWAVAGALAMLLGSAGAALSGRDGAAFADQGLAQLGLAAQRTPGVRAVALVDIGRFGWAFQGHVVDLVGLTDPHLAALPGGHANKPWDEDWFRAQGADLLIVRSETPITDPLPGPPRLGQPEIGLVQSVLARGGYRMHAAWEAAPERWMILFRRDGLRLPPELWGPEAGKDLRQLLSEAAP